MAFNANTSGRQIIEYAPDDTFKAAVSALEKSNKFSVKESNSLARTISIKTGVSWKSWGENLLITISPAANGMSEIAITSASKYGLIDWGKNQDNLNNILNLIYTELKNYNKIAQKSKFTAEDIPTQIKKLADLRDAGILTESEFQQKKESLLSKM